MVIYTKGFNICSITDLKLRESMCLEWKIVLIKEMNNEVTKRKKKLLKGL